MKWQPNPELPQDGLIYTLHEDGSEQIFARVDVTGLTTEQIAAIRHHAKSLQEPSQ
jgi:hypothetical protein